jgi:hypothetical protein
MLPFRDIIAQFEENLLSFPCCCGAVSEDACRSVYLAIFTVTCTQVVNFTTCYELVPDALDRVLVHANQVSEQPVRLSGIPSKFSGDQVTPLLPRQLTTKTVRFDGMMALPSLVQPTDDPTRIVLDAKFFAGALTLVTIKNVALLGDFDGDLNSSLGDVTLERLKLFRCEIWENLIRRTNVAVDFAHRRPSLVEKNAWFRRENE